MPHRRTSGISTVIAIASALVLGGSHEATAGISTYLALGDSLAFGVGSNDTSTDVSNGDRGYAGAFADVLATRQGGTRPNLINLGISGETTTSFFQPVGGLLGIDSAVRNTHYTKPPVTQDSLLMMTLAAEMAAGHTVSTVTIQLGANDLYQTALAPGFFNLTSDQQHTLILQTLGVIQANDTTLLKELRSMVPSAQIILMGYYDPYAPILADPTNPYYALAQAAHGAIPALNQVIAGEAAAFGGVYVDEYSPMVGHELAYTYIASGNSHPNATGYAALIGQLTTATVPEPSSLGLTLLGSAILALGRLRRWPMSNEK